MGFLVPLNPGANSRVRRTTKQQLELEPAAPASGPPPPRPAYRGGSLFHADGGGR